MIENYRDSTTVSIFRGTDQPRGRSFTGRTASASPDALGPGVRITFAPAMSLVRTQFSKGAGDLENAGASGSDGRAISIDRRHAIQPAAEFAL
jgi:hypothetical protein